MTVPVFDNFKEAKVSGAGAFSITIDKPTSIVENDLMVAVVVAIPQLTITSPGWTVIQNQSSDVTTTTFFKVAGASEPSNYTFSWGVPSNSYAFIMRITGHDTTTPINISGQAVGTSASPTCPSSTTTKDDCLILRVFGADGDNVTVDDGEPAVKENAAVPVAPAET